MPSQDGMFIKALDSNWEILDMFGRNAGKGSGGSVQRPIVDINITFVRTNERIAVWRLSLPTSYQTSNPGSLPAISSSPRGPVWHPDGYLLFSDIPANAILKYTPDGSVETYLSPSRNSNGLTFDRRGRLVACEHSGRQISV